jgi:hypothetical protein
MLLPEIPPAHYAEQLKELIGGAKIRVISEPAKVPGDIFCLPPCESEDFRLIES